MSTFGKNQIVKKKFENKVKTKTISRKKLKCWKEVKIFENKVEKKKQKKNCSFETKVEIQFLGKTWNVEKKSKWLKLKYNLKKSKFR